MNSNYLRNEIPSHVTIVEDGSMEKLGVAYCGGNLFRVHPDIMHNLGCYSEHLWMLRHRIVWHPAAEELPKRQELTEYDFQI